MAEKRLRYQGFGTIAGVKRVLWQILQKVADNLADELATDEQQRSWANTGIQAALAYSKLQETHELTQEVSELKRLTHGNGHLA